MCYGVVVTESPKGSSYDLWRVDMFVLHSDIVSGLLPPHCAFPRPASDEGGAAVSVLLPLYTSPPPPSLLHELRKGEWRESMSDCTWEGRE